MKRPVPFEEVVLVACSQVAPASVDLRGDDRHKDEAATQKLQDLMAKLEDATRSAIANSKSVLPVRRVIFQGFCCKNAHPDQSFAKWRVT